MNNRNNNQKRAMNEVLKEFNSLSVDKQDQYLLIISKFHEYENSRRWLQQVIINNLINQTSFFFEDIMNIYAKVRIEFQRNYQSHLMQKLSVHSPHTITIMQKEARALLAIEFPKYDSSQSELKKDRIVAKLYQATKGIFTSVEIKQIYNEMQAEKNFIKLMNTDFSFFSSPVKNKVNSSEVSNKLSF